MVFLGGLLYRRFVAGGVRLVASRTVVAAVAEEQVVAVGVRVVTRDVVRKAIGLRPGMLAVVDARTAADLHVARVLVEIDDVVGVAGILVSFLEDVPRIGLG